MTDHELQQNVHNALDWEPSIDATAIGVTVNDGVVTLRGDVASYSEKHAAERVALHVYGVKAVANDLNVRLISSYQRNDSDIAKAAVTALKWNTLLPADRLGVAVTDGWVTLTGTVDWQYQRDAAARAMRDLTGVKGVTNSIVCAPRIKPGDVAAKIEAAFKRSAEIDARRISVSARDGKVILTGNVRSWFERRQAENAAWAAPGVTAVEDLLAVVP